MVPYIVDIGLEVHVELSTSSKMFCGCAVVEPAQAKPNSSVCPVCLGMPGALPVINQKAVEFALRAALALGCEVAESSIFARKNYFYPDLPKGYQISQYEQPLAVKGILFINTSQGYKEIRIRRVHLEEDTGKLTHIHSSHKYYSLVDFNRSGVPLLEIVSEPDMHSTEDVRSYSYALRNLLRYIEITTGDMEKGAMRFEANLSLRPPGSQELGTRVEIKNLNSFRALEQAITHQIDQQSATLQHGEKVDQQTLGWNEAEGRTQPQRDKEEAFDYRYFPEPDLPPLLIEKAWLNNIARELPELPMAKAQRFRDLYQLTDLDIERLVEEKAIADYFEKCIQKSPDINPKIFTNWITGDLFGWMKAHGKEIQQIKVDPEKLGELLLSLKNKEINQNTTKTVLEIMLESGQTAQEIIVQKGLRQISEVDNISTLIQQTLDENPTELQSFLKGKETLLNWFFGQVMQRTKGKANPNIVKQELERILKNLKHK